MAENIHFLRIVAKTGKNTKLVEFPIDEATEDWLSGLQAADDETSDFTVRGNGIRMSISIISKGFEF